MKLHRPVAVDSRDEVCKKRTKPTEIDRVGIWPYDFVREDFLAVMQIAIEVLPIVECLAANCHRLGGLIKAVFDLRVGAWGGDGVYVLGYMNKRHVLRPLYFCDRLYRVTNFLRTYLKIEASIEMRYAAC